MDPKAAAANEAPQTAIDSDIPTDAELEALRKRVTPSIAQRVPIDLFTPGKEEQLRMQLYLELEEHLIREKMPVDIAVMQHWVDDMVAHMPKDRALPGTVAKPKAEVLWTAESLRAHVAPYIADHLGNALFEPGREAQLSEAVYVLVQEKIRLDGIEADDALRRKVMEMISSAMGIPMPSALNAEATPPIRNNTPPPPSTPPPDSHGEEKKTRPIAASEPRKPLTSDLRRQVLLDIASKLDPGVLGAGSPEKARTHVETLVADAVVHFHLELTASERDEIIGTILSGEGLEFQL